MSALVLAMLLAEEPAPEAVGFAAFAGDCFKAAKSQISKIDAETSEEAAVRVRPDHEQRRSEPEELEPLQGVLQRQRLVARDDGPRARSA